MIISLALALAMQTATAQAPKGDFVWVASMTLHAKHLNPAELGVAQHYASCMSLPYFPIPDEFAGKRDKCRADLSIVKTSPKLLGILDHLDALVRNQPGSEASLEVVKE